MNRTRWKALVLVVALAFVAVPTTTAYGRWSRTVTAQVGISVAAPAGPTVPAGLSCTSDSRAKAVTLSWTTVAGLTYTVRKRAVGILVGPSSASSGLTLNDKSSNMENNIQLVIRATNSSGATDSTQYFAVQLAAGTCTVTSP
jgi:hypothetical protein